MTWLGIPGHQRELARWATAEFRDRADLIKSDPAQATRLIPKNTPDERLFRLGILCRRKTPGGRTELCRGPRWDAWNNDPCGGVQTDRELREYVGIAAMMADLGRIVDEALPQPQPIRRISGSNVVQFSRRK